MKRLLILLALIISAANSFAQKQPTYINAYWYQYMKYLGSDSPASYKPINAATFVPPNLSYRWLGYDTDSGFVFHNGLKWLAFMNRANAFGTQDINTITGYKGITGSLQYNGSNGRLQGDNNLYWDSTNKILHVAGNVVGNNIWNQGGNSFGIAGKIGTLDYHPFDLWANNRRVMRLSRNGSIGLGSQDTPDSNSVFNYRGNLADSSINDVLKNIIRVDPVSPAGLTGPLIIQAEENKFGTDQPGRPDHCLWVGYNKATNGTKRANPNDIAFYDGWEGNYGTYPTSLAERYVAYFDTLNNEYRPWQMYLQKSNKNNWVGGFKLSYFSIGAVRHSLEPGYDYFRASVGTDTLAGIQFNLNGKAAFINKTIGFTDNGTTAMMAGGSGNLRKSDRLMFAGFGNYAFDSLGNGNGADSTIVQRTADLSLYKIPTVWFPSTSTMGGQTAVWASSQSYQVLFGAGRNWTQRVGTTNRTVFTTPNAAGNRIALLFGVDGVQQDKGIVYDRDNTRIDIVNGSNSNNDVYTPRMSVFQTGNVNIGSTTDIPNSLLTATSTTKATIPAPKMTKAQRDAITTPQAGFIIFNTDNNKFNYHNGTTWLTLNDSASANFWQDNGGGVMQNKAAFTQVNVPSASFNASQVTLPAATFQPTQIMANIGATGALLLMDNTSGTALAGDNLILSSNNKGQIFINDNLQTATTSDTLLLWEGFFNKRLKKLGVDQLFSRPHYTKIYQLIQQATGITCTVGAGAGTGATCSITGGDAGGEVTINSGTSPTAGGIVVTITYGGNAYSTTSFPVITPGESNAASLSGATGVYTTGNTTSFTITTASGAISGATTYKWKFHVTGQ